MNGGISFTLVTSSSISSSSSNTWNSVAIASNSNGTNGLFVAGSSGIYVSYGSTGSSWTNIISTPNIYYMTCNSDANFVFYNSSNNGNILYTATTTPTKKYKTTTTMTGPALKGSTKIDTDTNNNISVDDTTLITDTYSIDNKPTTYQFATVIALGSIYISDPLKNSYSAGSIIYIYPPTTTQSEILAEQNLPIPTPTPTPTPTPISDICFTRNTPIQTDQGIVSIHKIDPTVHSINNKKIIAITKSISMDNYLICFEKHALGKNIPSTRTIVTKYHKIKNEHGKMIQAYKYLDYFDRVKKIDYNGEILYNILMEEHETVNVNNLICETLHPEHEIAKLYTSNYRQEDKNKIIVLMNYCKKLNNTKTYQKIVDRLSISSV